METVFYTFSLLEGCDERFKGEALKPTGPLEQIVYLSHQEKRRCNFRASLTGCNTVMIAQLHLSVSVTYASETAYTAPGM